jgi:hypothetical protein
MYLGFLLCSIRGYFDNWVLLEFGVFLSEGNVMVRWISLIL